MDAILPVYKPVGITSFDVIRAFKRAQREGQSPLSREVLAGKIGHGGTLDPFADGVLLILLGKATKKMNELSALPKTYRAVAKLGASSDTLDRTGEIVKQITNHKFSNAQIIEIATHFAGVIEQEIPDYSATKINGVPRYKLARAGTEMERKSKPVTIHKLGIEKIENDLVTFTATVSSGTYIRQLSYDLFRAIGVDSYLEKLTRTEIGNFNLAKCCELASFSDLKWQDKARPLLPPAPDAS